MFPNALMRRLRRSPGFFLTVAGRSLRAPGFTLAVLLLTAAVLLTTAVVAVAALIGCWWPAWRAAQLSPVRALQSADQT